MFEEEPLPLESELWDMPEVGSDHVLYADWLTDVLLLSAGGNHTPCVWSEPTRGGDCLFLHVCDLCVTLLPTCSVLSCLPPT